jgi:hypothetical protein
MKRGIYGVASGLVAEGEIICGIGRSGRDGVFLILESFFKTINAFEKGLEDIGFGATFLWDGI